MDRRKPQHESAGRHGAAFWQEEKNNFGLKMMSQMGWQEGKGLGKEEKGQTSFLRAVKKDNALGIGAVAGRDEVWSATQNMYNDLLKRLAEAAKSGDVAAERPADAENDKEASQSTTTSVKKYMARSELYGKFKKAKDASNYDNKSMSEIFGRKEPLSSPSSSPSPSPPPMDSTLTTTNSGVSIRDYFAKKMAAGRNPASSPSPSPSPRNSATSGSSDDDNAPPRLEAAPAAARASQFQVAGGRGFSESFQESYYDRMMGMSTSGRMGLGLGSGDAPSNSAPREESFYDRIKREQKEKENKKNVKVKFEEQDEDAHAAAEAPRASFSMSGMAGGGMTGLGFVKSETASIKVETVVKTEIVTSDDTTDVSSSKKSKKRKVLDETEEDKEARLKKEKKAAKKAAKAAEEEAAVAAKVVEEAAAAKAAKKATKKAAKAAAAAAEEAKAVEEAEAAAKKARKAEKKRLAAEAEAAAAAVVVKEKKKKSKKAE